MGRRQNVIWSQWSSSTNKKVERITVEKMDVQHFFRLQLGGKKKKATWRAVLVEKIYLYTFPSERICTVVFFYVTI